MAQQDKLDQLFKSVSSSQMAIALTTEQETTKLLFDKQFDEVMENAISQIKARQGRALIYFSIGSLKYEKGVVPTVMREISKKFGSVAKIYLLTESYHGGYDDVDIQYARLTEHSLYVPEAGQFAIQYNNVGNKVFPNDGGTIDYGIVHPFMK